MNIPVPARIALVAGLAVVVAGGLFLGLGGTDTGPSIDETSRVEVDPQVAGRRALPDGPEPADARKAPDRTPDGRPIVQAPRNQRKRAMLERDPDEEAPYAAVEWDKERARAAELWHNKTNQYATKWLDKFPKDKQHDAILALKTYTVNVMEDRERATREKVGRDELRERLVDHRLNVEDEMTRILGERGAAQLNEYLADEIPGGGW
jgi:hypothetical protein